MPCAVDRIGNDSPAVLVGGRGSGGGASCVQGGSENQIKIWEPRGVGLRRIVTTS